MGIPQTSIEIIRIPENKRKMTKTKSQKQRSKQVATRQSRRRTQRAPDGVVSGPMAWPGSSASTPGRAHVRMVTEVFSSDDHRPLSHAGFATWSSQITGLLSPYKYFRVAEADVEIIVSGGAASQYAVAFNVSNAPDYDTGASAVLNDDYAAISTAVIRPKLHVPAKYWDGRPRDWYYNVTSTSATDSEKVAGVISLSGSGGAGATTVIGYMVLDLTLEFHTLI